MSTIYFAQLLVFPSRFRIRCKTTQKHTEREAFGGNINTAESELAPKFGTHHVHTQCVPRTRRGLDSVQRRRWRLKDLLTWWLRGIMDLFITSEDCCMLCQRVCAGTTRAWSGRAGWTSCRVQVGRMLTLYNWQAALERKQHLRPPAHTTIPSVPRICVTN